MINNSTTLIVLLSSAYVNTYHHQFCNKLEIIYNRRKSLLPKDLGRRTRLVLM